MTRAAPSPLRAFVRTALPAALPWVLAATLGAWLAVVLAQDEAGRPGAARRALPWLLALAAVAMLGAAFRAGRAAGTRHSRAVAAPGGEQGGDALDDYLHTAHVLRRIRALQEKMRKSPPAKFG